MDLLGSMAQSPWHDVGSTMMRCLTCVLLVMACSPGAVDSSRVPNSTPEATVSGTPPTATTSAPGLSEPVPSTPGDASGRVITLFVHEHRVDCHGEAPQKCLQIREKPTEEWSYFYDSIAGFEYEESYRYELRVSVSTDANPPADSSSLSYRLVEIVSKQQVGDTPPTATH